MTEAPAVIVTRDGPVATIQLNRPQARNAINRALRVGLTEALHELAIDEEVRVVVLRGDARAFSAGGDLKEAAHVDSAVSLAMGKRVVTALVDFPKVVVAVVRGHCAGAGISIALACDLVVADDTALFTPAFLAAGLVPDMGATHWLVRQIGLLRAKDLLLTGRQLTAAEALDLGLVSRLWPADELEERLAGLLEQLASLPVDAAGWTRRLLNHSFQSDLSASYEAEVAAALAVIARAQL